MECIDEKFMARAIEIAQIGWGRTNPNPLVGAVVVKEGRIIGEGIHRKLGQAHAERDILNRMSKEAAGATIYVNLEPCSHFGRTPPCVDIIKEKGIKRVVVAMEDPNPKVSGKGIQILKDAGIEVTVGVMEREAKKLNEIFIKYIKESTPFVILKTAMTLDGKTASHTGDSFWISGEKSRLEVHKLRQRIASIMVGVNTVIKDNPKLTVRLEGKALNNPVRIIVDSSGRIPIDSYVVETAGEIPTWVATTGRMRLDREEKLTQKGVRVIQFSEDSGRVDIVELMKYIHSQGVDSVLLEGGSELNASVIEAGVADKIIMYIAPKIIGGKNAPSPVGGIGISRMLDAVPVQYMEACQSGDDVRVEGYLKTPVWVE